MSRLLLATALAGALGAGAAAPALAAEPESAVFPTKTPIKHFVTLMQENHSYDNYFGTSPHRYIEFEFEDLETAAKYFQRPSISRIFEEVVDHGVNGTLTILKLRTDYAAEE